MTSSKNFSLPAWINRFVLTGDELRYNYGNNLQPWKSRSNWSETASGWQFLHNVPNDGSFRVEIPDSFKQSPALDLNLVPMEDNNALQEDEEQFVDLFAPVRKKMRGMAIYARKFKGNDEARSVSTRSSKRSSRTSTQPSTSSTSSTRFLDETSANSTDTVSETSARCSVSSNVISLQSAVRIESDSFNKRSQTTNQTEVVMSSQNSDADDNCEVQENTATEAPSVSRKRLPTSIKGNAARTKQQQGNTKVQRKPITSKRVQIVPKFAGRTKTKWGVWNEDDDSDENQLLTDGNLTPQTTESKRLSVIEEETSQPCTTPCRGTSHVNEGMEKLAAPSWTTNQLQTSNTKFQTPNLRNTDETETGMSLSKLDCFQQSIQKPF